MTRATILALGLLAAGTLSVRVARAEPPNSKAQPLYVLSVETDDADDQADALTQALRSRTRQAPGWSLAETGQSFGMLSIALKCPSKPDAACLQRIGDQLHADHYMWGTMSRHKPNQVAADTHLWTRGKGDADTVEVYSDNLKDASDETLKGIAARVFAKLTGGGVASGTLVIHAGTSGGTVLVDGAPRGTLENGVARVDLPGGPHTVAVRVPGFGSAAQQANVGLGADQDITFQLSPESTTPSTPSTPVHVRKIAAYTTIILGSVSLAVAAVTGSLWIYDLVKNNDDRNKFPGDFKMQNATATYVTNVCSGQGQNSDGGAPFALPAGSPIASYAADACKRSNDAVTHSTIFWITTGVGAALVGTGLYLLWTDHSGEESPRPEGPQAVKPRIDVVPSIGMNAGQVSVLVTY
jgi:hypothetical protein